MIRTIKLLGLTVTAALVASAMLASGASAEVGKGTFTAGHTVPGGIEHTDSTIVGKQYGDAHTNFFTTGSGANQSKLTCEIAEYHAATETGTETNLTVTPTYKDCYKFSENEAGEIEEENPATVTHNQCGFLFTSPETIEEGAAYTGDANLECKNVGEEIVIHIYAFGSPTSHFFNACTISVEQFVDTEVGGHIVYDNTEDKDNNKDITAKATITEIPYTAEGNCPGLVTPDTYKDATFASTVTVTAEVTNGGTKTDAWISD